MSWPATFRKPLAPLPAHVGPLRLPMPVCQLPVPLGFPKPRQGSLSEPLAPCPSLQPLLPLRAAVPPPGDGELTELCRGGAPRGRWCPQCQGHQDDADVVSAGAAQVRGLRQQTLELLHPFVVADLYGNSAANCSIWYPPLIFLSRNRLGEEEYPRAGSG